MTQAPAWRRWSQAEVEGEAIRDDQLPRGKPRRRRGSSGLTSSLDRTTVCGVGKTPLTARVVRSSIDRVAAATPPHRLLGGVIPGRPSVFRRYEQVGRWQRHLLGHGAPRRQSWRLGTSGACFL
jgi:hypothetical protein